jgi:hypothetical protein
MRNDLTDINIVLDRSGSMEVVRTDTIGGFNTFLQSQKEAPGEATLTLAQFDDQYEIVYGGKNIQDVPPLTAKTFVPRGSTALLDAIGRTINATGSRLEAMPEDERPGRVLFVILTDGQENASREFKKDQINKMIEDQTDIYQWDFVFLGANQDAIQEGSGMGFMAGNSMTYSVSASGVSAAYSSLSMSACGYRSGDGQLKTMFFSDEDRKKQEDAGV